MLIARQWFWWPSVSVGLGIGFWLCSVAISEIHPGTYSKTTVNFASGAPVTLEAKSWSEPVIEVWLDVQKLSPDEPNVSSLKPPGVRLEVVGGELRPIDYDQPSSIGNDHVGFELAKVRAKPGTLVKVTAHPSQESSAYDERKPVLKLHEWHPNWSGYFMIAMSANCLAIPLALIGAGVLVSRWSKRARSD